MIFAALGLGFLLLSALGVFGFQGLLGRLIDLRFAVRSGFAATTLVAAVCYAVALAHVIFGTWPEHES